MKIKNYNYKVKWLKDRGYKKHPKLKYLYQMKIKCYDKNKELIGSYFVSIDLLNDTYFISPAKGTTINIITSKELATIQGVYDIAKKTYFKMNEDAEEPYARLIATIYGTTKWTKKKNG